MKKIITILLYAGLTLSTQAQGSNADSLSVEVKIGSAKINTTLTLGKKYYVKQINGMDAIILLAKVEHDKVFGAITLTDNRKLGRDFDHIILTNPYGYIRLDNIRDIKEQRKDGKREVAQLKMYKLKSGKTFIVQEGQSLGVYYSNKKGKRVIKSSVISEIWNHQITFKPNNALFHEITLVDSTISKIGIATFGSVVRGMAINSLLLTTTVVYVVVVIINLFSSGSSYGLFPLNLPWDDFHRHIRVNSRQGIKKWKIETEQVTSDR